MFFVFEQLAKDMHKLFASGCMGQSDVNGAPAVSRGFPTLPHVQ